MGEQDLISLPVLLEYLWSTSQELISSEWLAVGPLPSHPVNKERKSKKLVKCLIEIRLDPAIIIIIII